MYRVESGRMCQKTFVAITSLSRAIPLIARPKTVSASPSPYAPAVSKKFTSRSTAVRTAFTTPSSSTFPQNRGDICQVPKHTGETLNPVFPNRTRTLINHLNKDTPQILPFPQKLTSHPKHRRPSAFIGGSPRLEIRVHSCSFV